jgi:addiction module RelE/StbE family toxin
MKSFSFCKSFEKQYKNLSQKSKNKFKERLNLLLEDEFSPALNNHSLNGKYKGYRSINVSGDMRAIYKVNTDNIIFTTIDNHNNLYK